MWNKIKSLLKMDSRVIKGCQIFKTSKEYKIITMYQVDLGRFTLRKPIYIVDISEGIDTIKNFIFNSLNESKKITYEDYYNNGSKKELLVDLKETSYNKLYRNSNSCCLYLVNGNIEIIPNKFEKTYLSEVKEGIRKMNYDNNELEITKMVLDILEKK